jgi:transposase
MLAVCKSTRKPASRHPFRDPLWNDDHPAYRRIDATLPADHHARWLRTVVARLDLTSFRLGYAGYGALAYPVDLLLAFVLFVYSKGILSPAEWATQARYDDQAKWLLRGLQPSRSLLYTFRDRVEPFLDGWHKQLIAWAVFEGITAAARASLDGTFVAALASRHQLMSLRRVDRRLLLLQLLVWLDEDGQADRATQLRGLAEWLLLGAKLWLGLLCCGVAAAELLPALLPLLAMLELLGLEQAGPCQVRLPAWMPASVAGRRRVLARYEQAQQRLTLRLQPYRDKKKLSKKDATTMKRLKVSLTDPEAALGFDKQGTYRPLYNVPLVQATDAPLTLAFDVLPRNNDDGLLKPMMEKTTEQLGRHLDEVLVDGAFLSVGEVVWCEQQGITVYGPPSKAEAARTEVARAEGRPTELPKAEKQKEECITTVASPQVNDPAALPKAEEQKEECAAAARPPQVNGPAVKEEKLPKAAFRYDSVEKVYYCPQGKRLEAESRTTIQRQNGITLPMIVHRAAGQDCQRCAQQKGCTSNPKKGRVVKRYEGEEALERLEKRMAEPANQAVYKQRGRSVELGYADIKEHRGLRVFRCFGRKRARAQAGLVILASNGLKIMHALRRRQTADKSDAPPPKVSA